MTQQLNVKYRHETVEHTNVAFLALSTWMVPQYEAVTSGCPQMALDGFGRRTRRWLSFVTASGVRFLGLGNHSEAKEIASPYSTEYLTRR